ncbi:MAG: hypothetical protein ACREP6_02015, partial [Candidatus Binataceae bacterium]
YKKSRITAVSLVIAFSLAITAGTSMADLSAASASPVSTSYLSKEKRLDPIQQAKALVDKAYAILNNPNLTLIEERRQMQALGTP